jgi:hypothetical protein
MNWDISVGLLGTAASLAGLAWHGREVTKLAFIFVALLAATLAVRGILYQQDISRVETLIISGLGTDAMTADQLYENVNTVTVTRSLFDDALNRAVERRRIAHKVLEVRTSDNVYMRVRAYFVP